eukprot:TRINITY_DN17623_c0_g1_i1.p1 TRINITY_DN17623_c0_g1~~TRINITY_DN17623_c0_g1_i1.p1  ORF type:complete len:190 (+),score=55.43 TRINITY_DN17623_c0_g1_i1:222-791(+)
MPSLLPVLALCLLAVAEPAVPSQRVQLVQLPRELQHLRRQMQHDLGEGPEEKEDDPSRDESKEERNATEHDLVPVDLVALMEQSRDQGLMVLNAANMLTAVEVNASDTYARWDETKAEIMRVNKKFPIKPIVTERYPKDPDPKDDTEEVAEQVGLKAKPAPAPKSEAEAEKDLEAEMDQTESLPAGLMV